MNLRNMVISRRKVKILKNNEVIQMLVNWQRLNVIQREIILLLLNDGSISGNYTDLTAKLDRTKVHISNVRRAAIDLQKRGLIYIYKKATRVCRFTLFADWQEKMIYNNLIPEKVVRLCDVKK